MKKILILYPHFPPSNLAGVHRPRLFAKHLPEFGWEPTILTVHEDYYEEKLDHQLEKLLPPGLRIEKVKAFKVGKVRLIGDIGLRAFFQLYKKARQLIRNEGYDFLYIPIPSFYCALLGRWLQSSTEIRYGIDYIDPWVHPFPGAEKTFSRHWWSMKVSGILEPIAVKKAALVTGVAEGYYKGVLERNSGLESRIVLGAMPYGGEAEDHEMVKSLGLKPYLFHKKEGVLQLVYAGAMLPKAYQVLETIFKAMAANPAVFSRIEIHFIGTGCRANDANSYTLKPLAEKHGLFNKIVFEYPERIPYLDVLTHLQAADGIFILGSTEPHYTPSKVYQGILSGKYSLAVLHSQSNAVGVLNSSGAGHVLHFDGESDLKKVERQFSASVSAWIENLQNFHPDQVNRKVFEQYSARSVTGLLVGLLNKAVAENNRIQ